jgi:CubicO group peptidase (beta-lactamase class C family)
VLGRIVEVVSGIPFDTFVEERITKPLGMRDTAFYLTAAQAPRLAEPQVDPVSGKRASATSVEELPKEKLKWFSVAAACSPPRLITRDSARCC